MRPLILILIWIAAVPCLNAQDTLSSKTLDEVVVTGQFEPQSLRQSVYQVRTIDQEMIRMRAATSVQGILNTELGVRFSNDLVLGTSDISLMGMSGQNVKILLDGVPLVDRGGTRESLAQIDVNTIDRIEIVEGPMSVVYGTDALAGVINIITRKDISDGDLFSIQARVQEETAGDEYAAFTDEGIHQENVNAYWQGKHWQAGGGVTRNNFGGWQGSSEGRAKEWLPKDQWFANGNVGYRNGQVTVWYRLNYLNEDISLLGNVNPNTLITTDKEYGTARYTHQAQLDWAINDRWNFNGVASYQDFSRRTMTTTLNTVTGDRRLTTGAGEQDESNFNSATLRGMFLYKLSSAVSLQPGIDINLTEGAGDRIDKTRTINDYAIFISSEIKPTAFINIRPGVRLTHNSVYDAPPVIPSLNTRFSLSSKIDLRVSYAYGFRAPGLRELYFSFFDASHSIKGNPDLEAEYSNSFSTSLSLSTSITPSIRLHSTLGGFYNAFENMITLGTDPENTGVNTYINIHKYRTTGATWSNAIATGDLRTTLGFSYIGVYNMFTEEDESLPYLMWTPEVNASVSYSFRKAGASISAYYKFTGKRSNYEVIMNGDEETIRLAEIESFHMADVSLSKRITRYLDLSVGVRNLFDVTRLQNTSLDVGGSHSTGGSVPMSYGRSYFTALTFHLSK